MHRTTPAFWSYFERLPEAAQRVARPISSVSRRIQDTPHCDSRKSADSGQSESGFPIVPRLWKPMPDRKGVSIALTENPPKALYFIIRQPTHSSSSGPVVCSGVLQRYTPPPLSRRLRRYLDDQPKSSTKGQAKDRRLGGLYVRFFS